MGRTKKNKYIFKPNEPGIGYFYNSEDYFIFDKEDYDIIQDYQWTMIIDARGRKRAYTRYKIKEGKIISLQLSCLVMGRFEGKDNLKVDHINGNTLDNRKENLRITTHQQNMMNRGANKRTKSGVTGVHYLPKYNRWNAVITVNKTTHYLGTFKTKEDAIKARKAAEKEYFGEYARK